MLSISTAIQKYGPVVQLPIAEVDQSTPVKKSPYRPWIRERLGPTGGDAARIVDSWRTERRAAPNLERAILLLDAIDRGDLDRVEQIAPLLVAALVGRSRRPSRSQRHDSLSSDPDSKSIKEREERQEEPEGLADMAQTVAEVALMSLSMNRREIETLARGLLADGVAPVELRDWYERWWKMEHSWGRAGKRPNLTMIREHVLKVRDLPTDEIAPADVSPVPLDIAQTDEGLLAADPPTPLRSPMPGGWLADRWNICLMGQLQIQLNRATYDAWIRDATLVDAHPIADTYRFVVTVPHAYAKEWWERHLLESARRSLTDFCVRRVPGQEQEGPGRLVDVIVEVEERWQREEEVSCTL